MSPSKYLFLVPPITFLWRTKCWGWVIFYEEISYINFKHYSNNVQPHRTVNPTNILASKQNYYKKYNSNPHRKSAPTPSYSKPSSFSISSTPAPSPSTTSSEPSPNAESSSILTYTRSQSGHGHRLQPLCPGRQTRLPALHLITAL